MPDLQDPRWWEPQRLRTTPERRRPRFRDCVSQTCPSPCPLNDRPPGPNASPISPRRTLCSVQGPDDAPATHALARSLAFSLLRRAPRHIPRSLITTGLARTAGGVSFRFACAREYDPRNNYVHGTLPRDDCSSPSRCINYFHLPSSRARRARPERAGRGGTGKGTVLAATRARSRSLLGLLRGALSELEGPVLKASGRAALPHQALGGLSLRRWAHWGEATARVTVLPREPRPAREARSRASFHPSGRLAGGDATPANGGRRRSAARIGDAAAAGGDLAI